MVVGVVMAGVASCCSDPLRLRIALFEPLCDLVHLVAELVERLCNLLLLGFELGHAVF